MLIGLIGLGSTQGVPAQEHDLQSALEALQVREGFVVQPIASEPLIADPVAIRFDHRGRLWVVEMPDYPTGPADGGGPNGRIKILSDKDADGVMDTAIVFADGLPVATGVQPYRDGALVTLSGKLLFLGDTDQDGIADQTEVLFQGFTAKNEQLRANHPTLAPNGLVFVANGIRGGQVAAVSQRFRPGNPLDLRERDFCFDPRGGSWHAVAGNSQFGQSIDDFGRRTGCSNRRPAIVAPLTLAEIARNPLLVPRDALHDVAVAGEASRVVPIARAWTTSNLHDGQFSAACGVCAPGLVDDAGHEWSLTCEPTGYLVQRHLWSSSGSVWTAQREPVQQEFLSSTDTWFRPVDAVAGPGDAIYVVDMARAVIEHPDFMPEELKRRKDLRDGAHLGRIWRVCQTDEPLQREAIGSRDEAIAWLSSRNPWQREVASHYLLEEGIAPVVAALKQLVASHYARAAARSAFLLAREQRLAPEDLSKMMDSDDARLVALSIQLAEEAASLALRPRLASLARHEAESVRRAVAAHITALPTFDQTASAALSLVLQGSMDVWTARTIACCSTGALPSVTAAALGSRADLHGHLAQLVTRDSQDDPIRAAEALTMSSGVMLSPRTILVLSAWVRGIQRRRDTIPAVMAKLSGPAQQRMTRWSKQTTGYALESANPIDARVACIGLSDSFHGHTAAFRELIQENQPPGVRVAVVPFLMRHDTPWMRDYLLRHLGSMNASLRSAAVRAATGSPAGSGWLLEKISVGELPRHFVDPATAQRLQRHPDPHVKKLATQLFRPREDRLAVIAKYAVACEELGDPVRGRQLFLEHCSACHRVDGMGTNVGPDISDSRTKTPQSLLASILDPDAAIDASYVQVNLVTVDGQITSGLLVGETSEQVTLALKGGQSVTIARGAIERMETPGVSLMPEGFEQQLNVPAMSDLLAYLKGWRYLKVEIPGAIEALTAPK